MNKYHRISALLALFALFVACGEPVDDADNDHNDHDQNDEELSVEEEICLHAQEGPDSAIERTASLDIDDVDPSSDDVASGHTLYGIELQLFEDGEDSDDEYVGYVAYNVEEDGTYGLFASLDIDVAFVDAEGNEVAVAESEDFDACPEIRTQNSVELPAGDYFLHLGPSSDAEVFTVTEQLDDPH